MNDPVFDITICKHSKDTRVIVNGDDVSGSIRRIRIEQEAGELPTVHLELTGIAASVRVDAAIRREDIGLQVPTADATPLGSEHQITKVLP